MELPASVRAWYRNPDGSCVQCSNGMVGVWLNCPAASTLLWDSEYGKKVRGGSWPERVAAYCNARGIPGYNVTGEPTWEYMRYAARTNRFCAIGAGGNHFQTLYGLDERGTADLNDDIWYVCNNNSTHKIDRYTWKQFQDLHLASGRWCVILDLPASPAVPRYRRW